MTRYIGPTVDLLVDRVRQAGDLAVELDFATQVLTICQQYTNVVLRRKITTESLTTLAEKLIYSITDDLTSGVEVVSILEANRELTLCPTLANLSAYDIDWFRKIDGTRFEAWAPIGRDMFVIYPGKASNSSVSVEFVRATTIYSNYSTYSATALELPDEDIDLVLELAEMLLLVRGRKLPTIETRLKLFLADLKGRKDVDVKS